MKSIHPKVIQQIFVLLLALLFGALIFKEMLPYFSGVLGAITIYVLLRKPMVFLVRKGWNPSLAAALLLFVSFICILLPVLGVVFMLGSKVSDAVKNSERVLTAAKEQIAKLEERFGLDLPSQFDTAEITAWMSDKLQGFAGSTFTIFISIGLMYFLLYYMLTNRRKMKDLITSYIPLSKDNINLITKESQATVRSNAIGIPLVAIAQGLIALIGFFIFGIEDPFFWFIIVTVGSMIPFVGTLVGILPVFILTLSIGDTWQAWGILLYGVIVVGSTDNLVRLWVMKKLDDVHPLITLIGVVVGVPLFGFIGLIFGPLLVSLFFLIVKAYTKEFGALNSE